MDDKIKGRGLRVSPRLGRVAYGAAELKELYSKHMTFALIFSCIITFALSRSLWLLTEKENLQEKTNNTVRIFKYTEIELPQPISDVEFGLSAYPLLKQDDYSVKGGGGFPITTSVNKTSTGVKNIPSEKKSGENIDNLPPGIVGIDKIQTDNNENRHFFGNEKAPVGHNDIAGGSGPSNEPWRRGGIPVPGKSGEPPSGVDISGVGASSKPSAGNSPYGFGGESDEEDEGGSGGFSMRWLQGSVRRKIAGELPTYPQEVNITAQVKIMAIVSPDGVVKSVQPVQKANRFLEESAMKAVRSWKFEPLPSVLPQVEQSCIITFFFKLK